MDSNIWEEFGPNCIWIYPYILFKIRTIGIYNFFSSFLAQVVNPKEVQEQQRFFIDSTMKYKGLYKGDEHSLIAQTFGFHSSLLKESLCNEVERLKT